jgi:hypothetical protein
MALLLLSAPAIEVDVSSGVAIADPDRPLEGASGIPVMFRAGVAPIDELTLSAAFLAVPSSTSCGDPCQGVFEAMSGLVIVRGHTTGTFQLFGDAGLGIGHMVRLAIDRRFYSPVREGRTGAAYWLGGGPRAVTKPGLTLGAEIAWTRWTNVSRPGSGVSQIPPASDLTVDAILLLLNVGWSFTM